jgi:kinesin family protein 4/21/27
MQRNHAAALAALREEQQRRLTEREAGHVADAERREAVHRAALKRAGGELVAARAEAAQLDQKTREDYERELASRGDQQREALAARKARFLAERDEAVEATGRDWAAQVEQLRAAHAESLEGLRHEHASQLASQKALREEEMVRRDDEYEGELRRVGEELANARRQVAQLEREARQREAIGAARSAEEQADALRSLEARLREEREQAVAALASEWKERMDRLRSRHADHVAAMKREHQDQLEALEAARRQGAARQRAAEPTTENVVPLKVVPREGSR